MVGIALTTEGNSIIVETNDYASMIGTTKVSFDRCHLGIVYFSKTNDYINFTIKDWKDVSCDVTGLQRIKIDSIDGIECDTLETLFNELTKLRN